MCNVDEIKPLLQCFPILNVRLCARQWTSLTLTLTILSFIDPWKQNKVVTVLETSKTHSQRNKRVKGGKPMAQMSFKLLSGSDGESMRLLFEV